MYVDLQICSAAPPSPPPAPAALQTGRELARLADPWRLVTDYLGTYLYLQYLARRWSTVLLGTEVGEPEVSR